MFVAQDLDVQVDQLQVRLRSCVVVTTVIGKVCLSEKKLVFMGVLRVWPMGVIAHPAFPECALSGSFMVLAVFLRVLRYF